MTELHKRVLTAVCMVLLFASIVTNMFPLVIVSLWAGIILVYFGHFLYVRTFTSHPVNLPLKPFVYVLFGLVFLLLYVMLDHWAAHQLGIKTVHIPNVSLADNTESNLHATALIKVYELFAWRLILVFCVWLAGAYLLYSIFRNKPTMPRLPIIIICTTVLGGTIVWFGFFVSVILPSQSNLFFVFERIHSFYFLMLIVSAILAVIAWEWYRLIRSQSDSPEMATQARQRCKNTSLGLAGLIFMGLLALYTILEYGMKELNDPNAFYFILTQNIIWLFLLSSGVWLIAFIRLFLQKYPGSFDTIFACFLMLTSVLSAYFAIRIATIQGLGYLLSIFGLVWVADIGAYFCGKSFGKHKLAPSISPGKTWEGALGGALLCVLYAGILMFCEDTYFYSLAQSYGIGLLILWVVVLVAVSIMGDLYESKLKRKAFVKDSSTLLPGHGGFFDRMDALLPVLSLSMLPLYSLDLVI